MSNPFDDPDARYLVLVNAEIQHSLWPTFADVPDGWTVVFGEAGRQECLDFIEASWTDMRPKSLVAVTERTPPGSGAGHSEPPQEPPRYQSDQK